MNCKNCGAELQPDAAFCEDCGAPVKAARARIPTYGKAEPKHKKSGLKTGLVILAVALLAFAALRITGVIGAEKPEPDKPETQPVQALQSAEKPLPRDVPEPAAVENPEEDDSPGVNAGAAQLSSTQTPTAEDFAWFTDRSERWVYGITPAEAYMLEDFYALLGSWKGLQMIYDYDGTLLGYGYFTATFEESGPNVAAALDWHYIDWADGSREELSEREDERMTGSFSAPMLALGEAGNRIELLLYAMDGKQYAEGKWTVQSGEEVRVALVRP